MLPHVTAASSCEDERSGKRTQYPPGQALCRTICLLTTQRSHPSQDTTSDPRLGIALSLTQSHLSLTPKAVVLCPVELLPGDWEPHPGLPLISEASPTEWLLCFERPISSWKPCTTKVTQSVLLKNVQLFNNKDNFLKGPAQYPTQCPINKHSPPYICRARLLLNSGHYFPS